MNNTIARGVIRALAKSGLMPRRAAESIKQRALRSPFKAYVCARMVVGGRWPEAEPVIAQDAKASYYYALNILQGRFLEGEEELSYSAVWFKEYWNSVLKRAWPDPLSSVLERARERYASILDGGRPGMILPPWEDRE